MNGRDYLALVHRLDCVVHQGCVGVRYPCAEAHHLESVRGIHSDFAAVPLCKDCHDLLHQMHRRPFYLLYGLDDVKLMAWTMQEVVRYLTSPAGQR